MSSLSSVRDAVLRDPTTQEQRSFMFEQRPYTYIGTQVYLPFLIIALIYVSNTRACHHALFPHRAVLLCSVCLISGEQHSFLMSIHAVSKLQQQIDLKSFIIDENWDFQ